MNGQQAIHPTSKGARSSRTGRQQLQHRLGHGAQEVAIAGLLQKFGQWQSVLGHRSSVQVKRRNSTLAGWSDDHLRSSANFHHERGRYQRLWARLKEWWAIATCYEKRASSFMGVLCLAATLDWLKDQRALVV